MDYDEVAEDVAAEVARAMHKFGAQNHLTHLEWQSVLLEEVGEAASLVTKAEVRPATHAIPVHDLEAEVVQVACVAIRWLMAMRHNRR